MSKLKKEEISNLSYDALVEHIRLSNVNSDEYLGLQIPLREELKSREPTIDYSCMKCSHTDCTEDQIRVSGGRLSSIFGIETNKYRVVVCDHCKFSEVYQGKVGVGDQIMDFFVGT